MSYVICSCVYRFTCVHACTCTWKPEVNSRVLFLKTVVHLGFWNKIFHCPRAQWFGQATRTTCLHKCAAPCSFMFLMWVLMIELRSSCLHSKHQNIVLFFFFQLKMYRSAGAITRMKFSGERERHLLRVFEAGLMNRNRSCACLYFCEEWLYCTEVT